MEAVDINVSFLHNVGLEKLNEHCASFIRVTLSEGGKIDREYTGEVRPHLIQRTVKEEDLAKSTKSITSILEGWIEELLMEQPGKRFKNEVRMWINKIGREIDFFIEVWPIP